MNMSSATKALTRSTSEGGNAIPRQRFGLVINVPLLTANRNHRLLDTIAREAAEQEVELDQPQSGVADFFDQRVLDDDRILRLNQNPFPRIAQCRAQIDPDGELTLSGQFAQ